MRKLLKRKTKRELATEIAPKYADDGSESGKRIAELQIHHMKGGDLKYPISMITKDGGLGGTQMSIEPLSIFLMVQ